MEEKEKEEKKLLKELCRKILHQEEETVEEIKKWCINRK